MKSGDFTYRLLSSVLLALLLSTSSQAHEALSQLEKAHDMELQHGLEKILEKHRLSSAVDNKKLALFIADLSDLENPRLAHVNGNQMMYAASLPKLAILVAAFVKVDRQQLELDESLWKDMNRMIRYSDNAAASRVLERVGKEDLLSILQEPEFMLYDREHGGGLWVGKAYSKDLAYRRDPLANLSHGATAIQAARVYYMLLSGKLLGPELSNKMLEILSRPGINHKLVKGLREKYPDATIYRKSGSWRNYHSDSAMIEVDNHHYLIVGLVEHPDGSQWLTNLAVPILDLLKKPKTTD
ncbi:MAG: serine hydrolase [Proteobacteria bacterium]|nr:serine hydrolase [Pseudomonadota bacterium]